MFMRFSRYMRYENVSVLGAICAARMFTRYMRYENVSGLGAICAVVLTVS